MQPFAQLIFCLYLQLRATSELLSFESQLLNALSVPSSDVQDSVLSVQVGFCTLYTFYAYPDRKRFRLSQILVLPPFQHHGVGAALLRAAYAMADKCDAINVTVRADPP